MSEPAVHRAFRDHLAPWLGWWVLSMLLWLLFTSTLNRAEAVVGVGASMIAATAAEVARAKTAFGFRPRLRWFRHTVRLPWSIVKDTWTVFAVLAAHATGRRRVRGQLRAVRFHHGRPGDPVASARRALVTAGVTMSPNTIVVGVDPDRDDLLVHQLSAAPDDLEELLGR